MNKKSIMIIAIEIVVLTILYSFRTCGYIERMPQCWIYHVTGKLCPACGGTRCMINILKGNWKEAFFLHPIFFIGILYLLSINIVYLINLNKEKKIATWIYPKYWYGIIFSILLISYTIIRNLL